MKKPRIRLCTLRNCCPAGTPLSQCALNALSDGVVIVDIKGNFLLFNEAAQSIVGYGPRRLPMRKWPAFFGIHLPDRSLCSMEDMPIVRALKGEEIPHQELFLQNSRKPHGTWISVSAAPILNEEGNVAAAVTMFRDITEQKRSEHSKTEFVALAAHQLRTPLSTILWTLELLGERTSNLTASQRKLLKDAREGSNRMAEIVEIMLTLSGIEANKIRMKTSTIEMRTLLRQIRKNHKLELEKRHQKCHIRCPARCSLHTDLGLLMEIITNLVSNASKYTSAGGTITMRCAKLARHVVIDVSDTGLGIPRENTHDIFTPFFRAQNAVEKQPSGTGLGLYLAHALVTLLRGRISFSSRQGKGTTFTVTLPQKHQGTPKKPAA